MDSKDFHLLAALSVDARQSYASLGRKVLLSAPAVRDRLNHLKTNRVLLGFLPVVDSNAFGRDDVLLIFNGEFSRKAVLAASMAPDVAWVAWKLDGQIYLHLWTKNERESTANLVKILSAGPVTRALIPHKTIARLSIIDLSLIDALVDNPKIPFGELVKSTRLSLKTVRKHLNLLFETKTISIVPILGSLVDSGELLCPLVVTGRVGMSEVQRIMGGAVLLRHTQEPPMKYMVCRGNSLADMITKTRALEKVKGVESVEISLNRELLVSTDFMHSLIREEIRKLEKDRMALISGTYPLTRLLSRSSTRIR